MKNNMNRKHNKTTSKAITSFDQLPAPADNWGRLSDNDWTSLLAAQPQFAEKCDDETLTRLAKAKTSPEGEDSSDADDEDDIKTRRLVRKLIQKPDSARLRDLDFLREMLDADGWTELLSKQPNFITHLQTGFLTGGHWARLLIRQPWLANRCEWGCMRGCDIAAVLSVHPEIADVSPMRFSSFWLPQPICPVHIDWARLQDGDWARLLAAQPRFAAQCPKAFGELRLAPDDWAAVLARRPEKAAEFMKTTLAYKVCFTLQASGQRDASGELLQPGGYIVSCGPIDESLPPRRGDEDDASTPLLDLSTAPLPSLEANIELSLYGTRNGYPVFPGKVRLLAGESSRAVLRNDGTLFESNPIMTGKRLWEEATLASALWVPGHVPGDDPRNTDIPMIDDFDEAKLILPYVTYRTDEGKERRVLLPHRMTYDGLPMHLSPKPFGTDGTGEPPRYWTVGEDDTRPYDGPYRNEES